jgi:hypothetical protein
MSPRQADDMDQDHKTITVERPTGPRITADIPQSKGELVGYRAGKLTKSFGKTALLGGVAAAAFLVKHKWYIGGTMVMTASAHLIMASMMMGIIGDHKPAVTPAAYTGPGDVISGAKVWYGLRAYSNATTVTKSIKLCDHLGTNCSDQNTTTAGDLDLTGLTRGSDNCATAGSACLVTTVYEKTGALCSGTCDVVQTTTAAMPTFIANCTNSKPCMRSNGTTQFKSTNVLSTAASAPLSISGVGQRSAVVTYADIFGDVAGNIQIGFDTNSGLALLYAGTLDTYPSAAENTYHALNGLVNGASSKLNVDGTSTNLSIGSSSLSGFMCLFGCPNFLGGDITEGGAWPGDQSASFNSLCHNQRIYWGSTGSC